MKLLDLFCGAGGAAMGYYRAGFDEILGVDIAPQPYYPFQFLQADALDFLHSEDAMQGWDVIHASPPCQKFSKLGNLHHKRGYSAKHEDMISSTRERLKWLGVPYVIENVPGAPLNSPAMLCGSMFNLKVYRHRLFETSMLWFVPEHKCHNDTTPSVGRGKSPKGFVSISGTGGVQGVPYSYLCDAIDIHWIPQKAYLSQAIPPAFTEYIGRQLLAALEAS